jgi:hypothetical protein
MNRTLLYTVQRVLEKLNLDPVSSIVDTTDSLLVTREAESTFYDLMSRAEWEDKEDLLQVLSGSDVENPTMLVIKENVHNITSLRYDVTTAEDTSTKIRTIYWVEPEEFLERSYRLNSESDNVKRVSYKGNLLFVTTDVMPEYYTSFDNKILILDSHNKNVEDTLIGTKSICKGKVVPEWLEDDTFIIPVQDSLYPLFLSMLASACSLYMNSTINQEDERRQARGISRMRREQIKTELEYFPKFKYGRNGNGLA